MSHRVTILMALVLGIIPSLLLFRSIYGLFHESAVFLESRAIGSSNVYTGINLKIASLVYFFLYVLLLIYFAHLTSGTKNKFFSLETLKSLNMTNIAIGIFASLIYLPLVFLLSSGANPW